MVYPMRFLPKSNCCSPSFQWQRVYPSLLTSRFPSLRNPIFHSTPAGQSRLSATPTLLRRPAFIVIFHPLLCTWLLGCLPSLKL
ncbi:hypothetical protein LINGRAHAP2_LOCUS7033 [Linum grandiflorum]